MPIPTQEMRNITQKNNSQSLINQHYLIIGKRNQIAQRNLDADIELVIGLEESISEWPGSKAGSRQQEIMGHLQRKLLYEPTSNGFQRCIFCPYKKIPKRESDWSRHSHMTSPDPKEAEYPEDVARGPPALCTRCSSEENQVLAPHACRHQEKCLELLWASWLPRPGHQEKHRCVRL